MTRPIPDPPSLEVWQRAAPVLFRLLDDDPGPESEQDEEAA